MPWQAATKATADMGKTLGAREVHSDLRTMPFRSGTGWGGLCRRLLERLDASTQKSAFEDPHHVDQ
jgi:hypothetical protein